MCRVIEHGVIESLDHLVDLDIIDWTRSHNWWHDSGQAIAALAPMFVGRAEYTILHPALDAAPLRDDFPAWRHAGDHVRVARLYWNWFHHRYKATAYQAHLTLSDMPDFSGSVKCPDGREIRFWGDFGQVSPVCMLLTYRLLRAGDWWISVNEYEQILIEPLVDVATLWGGTYLV